MKHTKNLRIRPTLCGLVLALAIIALSSHVATATPYASGCTNYTPGSNTGNIGFFINESGANVTVVYDDGTTNASFDGITTGLNVPAGSNWFNLAGHNGYKILCSKIGSGVPSQISTDGQFGTKWANIHGVAVNMNPKIGPEFGRVYAGSTGTGGFSNPTDPGYKPAGLFALNADLSVALGQGSNAYQTTIFAAGPWKMRVAGAGTGLDNKVLVTRNSSSSVTGDALYMVSPDLSTADLLLAGVGKAAGLAAGTHSDSMNGTPTVVGSLAAGTLQLWIVEGDWAIPPGLTPAAQFTSAYGPNTGSGMYNDLLCFNIGAGPIPVGGWSSRPVYAYTVGLEGIASLRPDVEIGHDGKIFAGFGRGNGSNPNIQILDPTGSTWVYMSGLAPGPYYSQDTSGLAGIDPWNGINGGGQVGTYAGIQISPDGKLFASVDFNNGITVASLTHGNSDPNLNGIPDDSTIFSVPNSPYTATSRGMSWDAAGNIYVGGQGQFTLRAFSLGGTTTCVTSNDWTSTNGTFAAVQPPIIASLNVTTPSASQNYGSPIAGVVRISLNTNFLSAPLTVFLGRSGTASYNALNAAPSSMYSINTNAGPAYLPYGVRILTNSVIFPAGAFAGAGSFYVDVTITPTTFPASTNTTSVVIGIANPAAYQLGTPSKGTIWIVNTGPQLLVLTAAGSGTTMYRGVTNDYAKFQIARYGDTNGPGNSLSGVTPTAYTITNITYTGTAAYPGDYRARAQRADPLDDNKIAAPVDGPTAIVVYPGDIAVTCILGGPVMHTNFNAPPADLTVVVNMPSGTSQEGFAYTTTSATVTLTEIDNAVGPEVVVWSDSMTNQANSINYTVAYANTNFGAGAMPVILPNYTNNRTSIYGSDADSTNDFMVNFGADISTNYYYDKNLFAAGAAPIPVPPSPVMLVSNWPLKALKMTVNKASYGSISGVNAYPVQFFQGNYALRFNMFLSLYDNSVDNPFLSGNYREYAIFGVNHSGTNCIWRPSTTMIPGTGMIPTNSDGVWFAVDAGYGGITPADLESYTPGPCPNNANVSYVGNGLPGHWSWSDTDPTPQGVFKHPPFDTSAVNNSTRTVAKPGGGQPVNKWVDVSVQITAQTNVSIYFNRSTWLANTPITNGPGFFSYTNGTIMLGYDDPDRTQSDPSSYVLYSNVRVVELSPSLAFDPGLTNSLANSIIVTQGASTVLTGAVTYATAPITSVWFKASAATLGTIVGETLVNPYVQSNWFNANSANLSLALNNIQAANAGYYVVQTRDPAGSVNSAPVNLEVISGPINLVATVGSTISWALGVAGNIAPTAYQWKTNGVNLANTAHYTTVTAATMGIVNVQPADALNTYSAVTTAAAGTVTNATATLTVISTIGPAAQTQFWGTPNLTLSVATLGGPAPASYQWRKNGANISGATTSALVLAPSLTTNNAGSYTVLVTPATPAGITGVGLLSAQTAITVSVPRPVFTPGGVTSAGGNTVMAFSSSNTNDTTTSFMLLQSPVVLVTNTPWTTNLAAVFTGPVGGPFQVSVPQTAAVMFYKLRHVTP
jgi:hypothetical protein